MRSDNIAVTLTIPMPIDRPDGNGNIYTKEAIENAVKNFKGSIPLKIGREDRVAGHINTMELDEHFNMTVKGIVYFGGTDEDAELNENKIVTKMEILAVGLDKGEE